MPTSNAPRSTPSTRWWRSAGATAGCCWQATPRTRRRPSSAGPVRRPARCRQRPGSSPRSCAMALRRRCSTATEERAPHVGEYIRLAVELGRIIRPATRTKSPNATAPGIGAAPAAQPQPAPRPERAAPAQPASGTVAAQPLLADGQRLDCAAARPSPCWRGRPAASRYRGGPAAAAPYPLAVITDGSAPVQACPDALQAAALVIRPDRYVYGAAADLRPAGPAGKPGAGPAPGRAGAHRLTALTARTASPHRRCPANPLIARPPPGFASRASRTAITNRNHDPQSPIRNRRYPDETHQLFPPGANNFGAVVNRAWSTGARLGTPSSAPPCASPASMPSRNWQPVAGRLRHGRDRRLPPGGGRPRQDPVRRPQLRRARAGNRGSSAPSARRSSCAWPPRRPATSKPSCCRRNRNASTMKARSPW